MAKIFKDPEILQILRNSEVSENLSVVKWEVIEKGGALTGFLGGYFCLKIEALIDDQPTTKNFFVKTLPASAQQSEFMEGMNLFQKEARIYSEILSAMPSVITTRWTPKCYFTRKDVIVLDDLSLENYKLMPSHGQDFTKTHVQLVLKSLAIMHANSLYLEQNVLKKKIGDVYKEILFEVSVIKSNVWFDRGIAAIKKIAMTRTRFSPNWVENNFDSAINKIYDIIDNYPKSFLNVFCHRDIWRNNLMYKFGQNGDKTDFNDPLECLLIDYQIARYQPPGIDVAMTLFMLQRITDRKNDFEYNLRYYYEQFSLSLHQLGINVEENLSFNDFLATIEHFKPIAATLKCVFLQMTHLPEGEIDRIHADDEEYLQFIMVDRGDTMVGYIDTDDYFKSWMVEAVEELLEILMS